MHSPLEIARNYIEIGIHKVHLSAFKMFILGIFAGMFIGFAGIASTTIAVTIENPVLARLLSASVFPAGMGMVLIAGSELFTGNNLIIIALLERKITLLQMLKNWGLVYLGNFTGAAAVAFFVVYGHVPSLFDCGLAESTVALANLKVGLSFGDAFIRGILCNILVCIAVWSSFAAKNVEGKLLAIFFPIMIFVLCGLEHSIANMYHIAAGIFTSWEYGIVSEGLSWGSFLLKNLLPVTIGNTLGGAGVVGFGYWAMYLSRTPGFPVSKEEEQDDLQHAEEY